MASCSVDGCDRPVSGRGWCRAHYMRHWYTGDVQADKPLQPKAAMGALLKHYIEVVRPSETDECIRWPFSHNSRGKAVMKVGGKQVRVPRYLCEDVHGQAPSERHQAAHGCGNAWCVNHRHLRWATPSENNQDKLIHGTHNRGERHSMAKLTEADVRKIISLRGRLDQRVVAKKFDVSLWHVKSVQDRRVWSWLEA